MIVDVHAHYYPPAYLRELGGAWAGGSARDQANRRLVETKIAPDPRMSDVDVRLEAMDRLGVDQQALSVSLPQVYFEDRALAVGLAQVVNDSQAELCRRHPDRFKGFASVPLPHAAAAVDELRRAIEHLGLHGLVLGTNVLGRFLDDPEFAPLLEEANRLRLAVFLHPMMPPGVEQMLEYDLAAVVGYLVDTELCVLRLAYSGALERWPELKIIVPHLGAFLPYNWNRLEMSFAWRPETHTHIDRPPTEFLKQLYYDTVNFHLPALRCACDTVGARQIVLGSDYPFGLGSMERPLALIRELGLPAEIEAGILGETAGRLLRP